MSTAIFHSSVSGDCARGRALLRGEPPGFGGVGGTLPPRLSPLGERERGMSHSSLLPQALSLCSFIVRHRQLALLPFALSCGALDSGASWCPHMSDTGCCYLRIELDLALNDTCSAMSTQSPELGDVRLKITSLSRFAVHGRTLCTVAQRFIRRAGYPQLVQQNGQLAGDCDQSPFLSVLTTASGQA
jgi:hypothetical protein